MNYKIKIKLLSETIMGSGQSIPGDVDNDILYDGYGLPYIKGKTLKGNIREKVEEAVAYLKNSNPSISEDIVNVLFGKEGNYSPQYGVLNISNGYFSEGVSLALIKSLENTDEKFEKIYPSDIISAITNDRSFTKIEDQVAKKGSLRTIRTLDEGHVFFANISANRKLSEKEEGVLAVGIKLLNHMGLMRTRGKGEVECSLLNNKGEDILIKAIRGLKDE